MIDIQNFDGLSLSSSRTADEIMATRSTKTNWIWEGLKERRQYRRH